MKRVLSALTLLTVTLLPAGAFAAEGDPMPGANLWAWISANVLGAFPVILACVSLYYLVRRAFAAFISFAVFAMVVAVFVFAPNLIQAFGVKMAGVLLR